MGKPVAYVVPIIKKQLHVRSCDIQMMNEDELMGIRDVIVRAIEAQRYHGESNVSDQYMSWVRGLYYVDTSLWRLANFRGDDL